MPQRLHRLLPALLGLALGVLALGPALGPGFVLRYDMVFVPDPPLRAEPGGAFPRAVPSDQVVALLSAVLPAEAVQKLILLGVFVLAASGAAALVPGGRTGPRLVAAACYAWNAYLAQRLLLGHWALLLGYAGLPWAVRAAARGGVPRLLLALLPAAAGGFKAMLITALAVLPVSALAGARRLATAGGAIALFSLPWLIPALRATAETDPAGVAAFAPRADGPFGTLGSLLMLGGVWNAEAEVPGQGWWAIATVRLVVTAVALAGFAGTVRAGWPAARGLGLAAAAGLLIACTGAFAPGALRTLIEWWAGFGTLRDGQLFIAPLALAEALGLAAAASRLGRMAVAVAAVPVLVLPTFALGAFGRLAAVEYPAEWRTVQRIVNRDPAPGALVSLPWGAYRAFEWNGGRVVLDPATKLFARRVLWDDTLIVGTAEGPIRVAPEDPEARRIGALLARGGPLTAALRDAGVRYVLVAGLDKNRFLSQVPGARVAWSGEELLLLRL
ncbi:hypothetical protein TBS_24580 [Thermobispora bispora]|uniref:Uncharacterized protein n=1 Tax=Thermobispora bispora (strain ATCC 19993 / DSM 43833 / CBS 139.67 / JCM 10125 / KCTC 9307 / NBRC 14880 / R51) TaxID=469371 RepID=D6Y6F4_THEBD|nr:hypothetical protein [Thermobispora bispora]ADG87526.1 hypothetical protein Tbis_0802 [Thermobispora bispora DSM 43833]MBO2472866.1 hypothetical protein [Actinomycetales bacterium]QSI47458.1 hypothetical protein CYL17_05955 [Thermobispora bispora]